MNETVIGVVLFLAACSCWFFGCYIDEKAKCRKMRTERDFQKAMFIEADLHSQQLRELLIEHEQCAEINNAILARSLKEIESLKKIIADYINLYKNE